MCGLRSVWLARSPFVLGAILLTAAPAAAQVTTSVGVQGGLNLGTLDFTAVDGQPVSPTLAGRTRVVFGAFVAWDFKPKVGLQVDALYSQKGAKLEAVDEDGSAFKFEASVDYVEFPVLIRANLPASDTVKVRLFAGPAFSFKVSADSTVTLDGQPQPDEDPSFKSRDVCLVIGGAVQFGPAFVDVRYSWGLTNIVNEAGRARGGSDELRTRTFAVMVGFSK